MDITSAVFAKGVTNQTNLIQDGLPQVAFIGRSNVGKSSLINSLTNNKSLARSSSTPGRTREINFFLINKNSFYLVDLPGYGYAEGSTGTRQEILNRIKWYLFESGVNHKKIFLVIDAKVGFTDHDLQMFTMLQEHNKNFVIIANKIDKLNMSEKHKSLTEIHKITGDHLVIPHSSDKKIGRNKVLEALEM